MGAQNKGEWTKFIYIHSTKTVMNILTPTVNIMKTTSIISDRFFKTSSMPYLSANQSQKSSQEAYHKSYIVCCK